MEGSDVRSVFSDANAQRRRQGVSRAQRLLVKLEIRKCFRHQRDEDRRIRRRQREDLLHDDVRNIGMVRNRLTYFGDSKV